MWKLTTIAIKRFNDYSDWHPRADERHRNPPQGNQERVGQRQSWKPPDELGVNKSMECGIFSLQSFDTVGWATGRASGLYKN